MRSKLYIILTLFCLQTALHAQDSSIDKYELDFPQLGIGISIGVDGKFDVPPLPEKGELLRETDGGGAYYFNLSCFDDSGTKLFLFRAKDAVEFMGLTIGRLDSRFLQFFSSEVKDNGLFSSVLLPLETKEGNTYSYQLDEMSEKLYVHTITYKDYGFIFTMRETTPKEHIKFYESIIKSFEEKDFPERDEN